jgi:hypothetical protein
VASQNRDDSLQSGLYKDYRNDFTYQFIPGVVVVPGSNGSPVAVRIHKPYSVRTQEFDVRKESNPPVVPALTRSDNSATPGDVLLAHAVVAPAAAVSGTNPPTWSYSLRGRYVYLEGTPHVAGSPEGLSSSEYVRGYRSGRMPFRMPSYTTMQAGTAAGFTDESFRNALGAVLGGVATTDAVLAELTVPIESGTYVWPFGSFIPSAFFDPTLA